MNELRKDLAAPLTAAALIAQQVAANAIRDGLFLTWFPVTSLPFFVAAAAILAIPAVGGSGRLLARFGPARVVPGVLAVSGVLFFAEWILLGSQPQAATVLLYAHSSVLGAIAISTFWSLLNECFDPHAAKPMLARVAAAAAFGGLVGGVGAERVAAMMPEGALLLILGVGGGVCATGAIIVGRAAPARQGSGEKPVPAASGWSEIRRVALLRDLALVVAIAAALAALVDFVLKAEAVAYFGKGEDLVRFFGLFYAGTGLAAFLLQATLGRFVLRRLGLGGAVASHAAAVGAACLLGFVVPGPWRGICSRGLDVSVRGSVFRAGYELFYTPLPESTKRSAKSVIDVAADCFGKGAGAAVILMLTTLIPGYATSAVNVAERARGGGGTAHRPAAAARLCHRSRRRADAAGRRPRACRPVLHVQLHDGPEHGRIRPEVGTPRARTGRRVETRGGPRRSRRCRNHRPAVGRSHAHPGGSAHAAAGSAADWRADSAARGEGNSASGRRSAGGLRHARRRPARRRAARSGHAGHRAPAPAAGAEDLCLAARARRSAAGARRVQPRGADAQCARPPRAHRQTSGSRPAAAAALLAVERELAGAADDGDVREHVFNLLGLALEREPVRIAAMAFDTSDQYLRGTALEYLETVLPPSIFAALAPRLSAAAAPVVHRRGAAMVRAELAERRAPRSPWRAARCGGSSAQQNSKTTVGREPSAATRSERMAG
jgi:hypothetical protein